MRQVRPTLRQLILVVAMAGILSLEPAAEAQTTAKDDVQSTVVPGQIAPRLQNLGNHQFPVTTSSARAQLFINQAMMLVYGFNHAEATRSFREAARLDPNCAMAYWGMALVLGIVRGHDGLIVIDSEPGKGARISVLFPVTQA